MPPPQTTCASYKRVQQYLAVRPELKLQKLVPELPFVSHIVAHIEVFCRHRSSVRTSWMWEVSTVWLPQRTCSVLLSVGLHWCATAPDGTPVIRCQ